ncbi:MAG TPA: hypothetical protein VHQ01_00600 [Pyrinomonadaceae bacterium]|nr:hypothetical protein [Pyrinomonadaceae bacterium]
MKTYKILWALFGAVVAGMWPLGMLTDIAIVLLGMTAFGLVFFGMITVIPLGLIHGSEPTGNEKVPVKFNALKYLTDRWTTPDVAMRELKYH